MKKAVTDVGTSKYQFTEALGSSRASLGNILRFPTDGGGGKPKVFFMQMKTVALAHSLHRLRDERHSRHLKSHRNDLG